MSKALGEFGMQFFAYVERQASRMVRAGVLQKVLGLSPVQEQSLLSRLARQGLIVRVRPGLYLAPAKLPPGGKWSPGEALALNTLMADKEGEYQICGPNAFYRYGWVDQVPNRVYAYNNRISGDRKIGVVALTLIKVADDRLGATETITTPDGIKMVYSSKARSLLDAVYDWSRFNSLPQGYAWIREELASDDRVAADLVKVTLQYGNQGTLRRIGKLLEMEGAPAPLVRKLRKALRPSSSFIPWDPTRPKRGTVDQHWGVVWNDES